MQNKTIEIIGYSKNELTSQTHLTVFRNGSDTASGFLVTEKWNDFEELVKIIEEKYQTQVLPLRDMQDYVIANTPMTHHPEGVNVAPAVDVDAHTPNVPEAPEPEPENEPNLQTASEEDFVGGGTGKTKTKSK